MSDYADDCIHLRACRRMAKIWRESGSPKSQGRNFVARGCSTECTAYEQKVEAVPFSTAASCLKTMARNIECGYSPDEEVVVAMSFLEKAVI